MSSQVEPRIGTTRPRPLGHAGVLAAAVLTTMAVIAGAPAASMASPLGGPSCDPTFVPRDAPDVPYRVAHCPEGTTFTFAAGTYRLAQKIIPRVGDVLIGAGSGHGGTRFTGSKVLTSWTQQGAKWVHTGDALKVGVMKDPCEVGRACDYQDWLYRNGDWLKRVLSPCGTLTTDQFCIDYTAKKIYVGANPNGELMEYATVTQFLVGYRFGDVTAKHFSYDEFATVGGGIQGGDGWFVDDVHGHHIHACGISLLHSSVNNPSTVQNSTFDNNGYTGYCDPGDSQKILNNEFAFNNRLHFAHGMGVGLHGALGGLIQGNRIHDNYGVGLALQKRQEKVSERGTKGVVVRDNVVTNNSEAGIRVYNSCLNIIDSNVVRGNMRIGIDIDSANSNTISNNTVVVPAASSAAGIRIYGGDGVGSNNCGSFDDARNNTVTGNDITMSDVSEHGNFGSINGVVGAGGRVSGERFLANTYHMPDGDCSVTNWKWWAGGDERTVSFGSWRTVYLQDQPPAGTCGR
jgi:parallel beta-helix repeat protein